jgi:citrate lyase subunit beta / citryl-CoA lyase
MTSHSTDDGPWPLRSMLFVPGDNERKVQKAQAVPADALIVDLEDSVDGERKEFARELAVELAQKRSAIRARALWIRVNGVGDAHFGVDLSAAVRAGFDGIVLPKSRGVADVLAAGAQLDALEARAGREIGSTKILPIATETPAAVFALGEYARCGPRLAALTWGAEDLSSALGASTAVDEHGVWLPPYALARALCLLAAGAAEVPAIDTVHTDVRDLEGLRRSALAAQRDGFTGKLAVHPDQVEILNQAFRPSPPDVAAAQAVVAAFAKGNGAGVVSLGGKMLDRPHLLRARRTLALAAALDATADRAAGERTS